MLWWHLRNPRSGSPRQQLRAAQRLGSYRDAKAITALKDVQGRWSNRGDDVKAAACVSLEKVADSQAVEALASVFRWGAGDPLFESCRAVLGLCPGVVDAARAAA